MMHPTPKRCQKTLFLYLFMIRLKLQCLKILMNLQKYQPNQAVHRLVFMWFQLSFKKHIIPVFVLLSTKTDLGRLA